ncbi:MAG TPA: YchJ family metal-binding protein [Chlamydiales bacterium]|nr:YchJ family metal-binding protein [Chlamydiales bacterium]
MKTETFLCPCHSQLEYSKCCKPLHEGSLPQNALKLMRSRFSAYTLNLSDYIIQTTYPNSPAWEKDLGLWENQIKDFCRHTKFIDLIIHHFSENETEATVTFTAILKQNNQDVSFKEKSFFKKVNNKWFYYSGEISNKVN